MRKIFAISTVAVLLLSTSLISGCKESSLTRTFFAADTVCSITLYDGDETTLDGAVELCNKLAGIMDANNESSPLCTLNKEKALEKPDQDLFNVIKAAKDYAEISSGVFDPTIRAFTRLWDFKSGAVPSSSDLQKAAQYVGYEKLSLENERISLLGEAEIELGAIAKGYISQRIYEYLKSQNVTSAIINLGGNVTLLGNNKGERFLVGIQKPFEQGIVTSISAEDCSVVTSGIYQRYIEKDGVIYHHLLNSKTGMPEQNSLFSVTVISKSGTEADALSTLCFLLGKEKGMKYIESLENTEAVFIDRENNLHLTSGLTINNNIITQ